MNQLVEFASNHWPLVLALVLILGLIAYEETKRSVRGLAKISPADATRLINREGAMVIDLRDKPAYESGHIIDAVHFLPSEFDSSVKKIKSHFKKSIILVGTTPQAAINIGVKLRDAGAEQVSFLTGGMQAWRADNFPIIKQVKNTPMQAPKTKEIAKKNTKSANDTAPSS
jgi:rhodanese-related sulfurtransferase